MDKDVANTPPSGAWGGKHEIVACERCRSPFECKANSFTKCQCMTVELNINETQYISEQYDACLCASCLAVLWDEYRTMMDIPLE